MSFKKLFKNGSFRLELRSSEKAQIIEEMIDMMAAEGRVLDRDKALEAVQERENKMSTGMQHGIAIPHGKTDAVDSLAVALAMKKEGVDFGSLDGKPARIFVMTLSPLGKAGPHITYLSEISKLLNKSSIRERLLNCETEEEMKRVMLSG